MTDIPALLERVREADGPDRELDRDIGMAIAGWCMKSALGFEDKGALLYVPEDETYYSPNPGGMYPALTKSVDLALALVERKLPGWTWQHGDQTRDGLAIWLGSASEPTPALAILASLLSALIAQGEQV